MKSLDKMDNVDRGRLLADLLPQELPNITRYIETEAEQLRKNSQFIKANWSAMLFNVDYWFSLVENVDKKIKKCGSKLHTRHGWFADQLFDGYDGLFTLYCLQEYALTKECSNPLRHAIYLIFGEARLILTVPEKPKKN